MSWLLGSSLLSSSSSAPASWISWQKSSHLQSLPSPLLLHRKQNKEVCGRIPKQAYFQCCVVSALVDPDTDPGPAFLSQCGSRYPDPGSQSNADPCRSGFWSDCKVTKSVSRSVFPIRIQIRIQDSPMNADPCGSGSTTLLISRFLSLFFLKGNPVFGSRITDPLELSKTLPVPRRSVLDPDWIRIHQVGGSGSRYRSAKMTPKNWKKVINFMFWSAGCSLLRP